ncbi:RNA-binding protein 44 isoform X1 [Pyxicephalus adspersus]|uniref:RNA-binding protein 44 isoform X1 n=1 Tax=Pyxicephalus adspersus TaxID=30357 RepID=UPI003B59E63F
MDHQESKEYTAIYFEKKLYTHEDEMLHFREHTGEVVHCEENFWFDQGNCSKQKEVGNINSNYQYTTQASIKSEHPTTPIEPKRLEGIKPQNNYFPFSLPGTGGTFGKKDVNLLSVKSYCSSDNQIVSANTIAIPEHLPHSYVQADTIFHKCEEAIPESWDPPDHFKFTQEGIFSGNKCTDFQEPGQVVLEKDSQNIYQWQKGLDQSENSIDQECSASDTCDDETFMSVKSGNYSRSSSPFSFEDHTDTESCLFEEALEDLSSNFVYNQNNNLHGLLCTSSSNDHRSAFATPDVEDNDLLKAMCHKINNSAERTATEQKNKSCNTDLSLLIDCHSDKATQTKEYDWQEKGVNTDLNFAGYFTQGAVGSEDRKDINNCKENTCSTSHETLKKRAVKAELQLLDVQRWMCWQLCWKTQQQCMEKQSLISMHTASTKFIDDFNLLSALAEVEEKYLEIKAQIQSGVPHDALVPLSMQLTKVKTPPDNLLNQCFSEICQLGIQKGSVPEDVQKNKPTCVSTPGAAEDLHKENGEKLQNEQLSPDQKRCYVHVGNIAPIVNKVDLKHAFKEYGVSNVFLEESSLTSSYAVLIFTCAEKAQEAVKEMDGKMFFGKKLKVRVVKNSIQNFQFASQEIKKFSTSVPEEETKHGTVDPQNCNVRSPPENRGDSSKPTLHSEFRRGSNWVNVNNIPSNKPYNRATFPAVSHTIPTSPAYNSSAVFGCISPSHQWAWNTNNSGILPYSRMPDPVYVQYTYPVYTFSGASPFSVHTPVNTSMCKPNVHSNSNVQFVFGKDVASEALPTRGDPVYKNTVSLKSSTNMLNRDTKAVTNIARKTPVQPIKEPASVILKSSKMENSSSVSLNTTATTAVSSTVPNISTPACKISAASDNLLPHEDKSIDTSEKTNFKPTAPLRFPMSVPESVSIPETKKICYSTTVTDTKVLLKKPSNGGDLQQSGSLFLEKEEWGVYPKLDLTSEHPVCIVANSLNISQFRKVVKYLLKHHKNITR